jgi:hypothetical protein
VINCLIQTGPTVFMSNINARTTKQWSVNCYGGNYMIMAKKNFAMCVYVCVCVRVPNMREEIQPTEVGNSRYTVITVIVRTKIN